MSVPVPHKGVGLCDGKDPVPVRLPLGTPCPGLQWYRVSLDLTLRFVSDRFGSGTRCRGPAPRLETGVEVEGRRSLVSSRVPSRDVRPFSKGNPVARLVGGRLPPSGQGPGEVRQVPRGVRLRRQCRGTRGDDRDRPGFDTPEGLRSLGPVRARSVTHRSVREPGPQDLPTRPKQEFPRHDDRDISQGQGPVSGCVYTSVHPCVRGQRPCVLTVGPQLCPVDPCI